MWFHHIVHHFMMTLDHEIIHSSGKFSLFSNVEGCWEFQMDEALSTLARSHTSHTCKQTILASAKMAAFGEIA